MTGVTGPGSGRTVPLPNDCIPSHACRGKFLIAGGQVAGSCHWQLIFERWANHCLGDVKPTPRKNIVILRANRGSNSSTALYASISRRFPSKTFSAADVPP